MRRTKRMRVLLIIVAAVMVAAMAFAYILPIAGFAANGTGPGTGPAPGSYSSGGPGPGYAPAAEAAEEEPVPSLKINYAPTTMDVGEEATLSYELLDAEEGALASWSSSNESIATIAADGHVVALAPGTVEFTASVGVMRTSVLIKINALKPQSVHIQIAETPAETAPGVYDIKVGDIYHLSSRIEPTGSRVEGKVTWSLSNPDAATLDGSREFIATDPGETTVTVTADELTASVTFRIEENGIPTATIIRYAVTGGIIIVIVVIVILLASYAARKEKEARKRAAAKRRKEAEQRKKTMDSGRERDHFTPTGTPTPTDARTTKVYGAGVGAADMNRQADSEGRPREPERPFSIDDLE